MRTLFKWLLITAFALVLFLIVLLGLGYLLKENEETTNELKVKLNQEMKLKQEKEARRQALFLVKPKKLLAQQLTPFESSQQKIITDNLYCRINKECFLVQTDSKVLGCLVAVNSTGLAILLKTSNTQKVLKTKANDCQQEYLQETELTLSCQSNTCALVR